MRPVQRCSVCKTCCKAEGCQKKAYYNLKGKRPALFCGQHRAEVMVSPARASLCTAHPRFCKQQGSGSALHDRKSSVWAHLASAMARPCKPSCSVCTSPPSMFDEACSCVRNLSNFCVRHTATLHPSVCAAQCCKEVPRGDGGRNTQPSFGPPGGRAQLYGP